MAGNPPKQAVHTYPVRVSNLTSSGGRATHAGFPGTGAPTQDQVLDQVDLAVIATDADGVVTTWNVRAETLYGWTRGEAIGRHIAELTVPPESRRTAEEVMATLGRGEAWQGQFRLRRKDGSLFTAFVKDSPILDEDGELIGIVGVSIELGEPALAQAMKSVYSDGHRPTGRRTRTLSPREREVLGLLARGLTGEQIAERLVLSPETVRTHIRNAREKLGASTRVEAVTTALLAREIQI
jgi:PAS domain S-box-containing protein